MEHDFVIIGTGEIKRTFYIFETANLLAINLNRLIEFDTCIRYYKRNTDSGVVCRVRGACAAASLAKMPSELRPYSSSPAHPLQYNLLRRG